MIDVILRTGISGTIHATHEDNRVRLTVTTGQLSETDDIVADVVDGKFDNTVTDPFMFRIPTTGSSYATPTTRTTWAFCKIDRFMTIGLTAPIGPDGTIGPVYNLRVIAAT
jgi:hypothetical protein